MVIKCRHERERGLKVRKHIAQVTTLFHVLFFRFKNSVHKQIFLITQTSHLPEDDDFLARQLLWEGGGGPFAQPLAWLTSVVQEVFFCSNLTAETDKCPLSYLFSVQPTARNPRACHGNFTF